jgi:hypothetical protein
MNKFTFASVVAVVTANSRKHHKTVLMADFEEFTFTNLIDHFTTRLHDSNFEQRYWTND